MLELKDKDVHPLIDAAIIVLIIVDTFLLILITFYDLNHTTILYIIYFDLAVCFVLFVEFVYRIRKETNKKGYAIKHWYDIIAMIPLDLIAYKIPFLRAFRFFRFLRYARIVRVFALVRKSIRHFGEFIKDTHLHLSLGILIFTIFSGTIIFFILESGANTKVQSLWILFGMLCPLLPPQVLLT
jgi:voltage-gated potassium channel